MPHRDSRADRLPRRGLSQSVRRASSHCPASGSHFPDARRHGGLLRTSHRCGDWCSSKASTPQQTTTGRAGRQPMVPFGSRPSAARTRTGRHHLGALKLAVAARARRRKRTASRDGDRARSCRSTGNVCHGSRVDNRVVIARGSADLRFRRRAGGSNRRRPFPTSMRRCGAWPRRNPRHFPDLEKRSCNRPDILKV